MRWKVKQQLFFFRERSAPLAYIILIVKYSVAKSDLVRMRAIRSLTIFLSRTNKQTRSQITLSNENYAKQLILITQSQKNVTKTSNLGLDENKHGA